MKSVEELFSPSTDWLGPNVSFQLIADFDAPPVGETVFKAGEDRPYKRQLLQCSRTRHCLNASYLDVTKLYETDWVDATYQDVEGIRRRFERIIALSVAESDNKARVSNLMQWLDLEHAEGKNVLDVGAGLGVFPHEMKAQGWRVTALDPDPRNANFMKDTVEIEAVAGHFETGLEIGTFDLITFNKVLEHVENPVDMLKCAKEYLKDDGRIYIELPDSVGAMKAGPEREEFYIDHLHIFSEVSIAALILAAGFELVRLERLVEPSGKYTLRALIQSSKLPLITT